MTDDPNSCGNCSMCCKFMAIPLLHKDDGEWCQFCNVPNGGKGCSIYKDRPPVCEGFQCLWLATQGLKGALKPHLRPDKCKVMIGGTTREDCIMVYVDPARPDAWRDDEIQQIIGKLVAKGVYAICTIGASLKARFFYLARDGSVHHRWVDMGPPDAEGTKYVVSDLSFLNDPLR